MMQIERPQELKPPLTITGIYNQWKKNWLLVVIITAIITTGINQLANRIFQRPQEVQVDEYFGHKYQMDERRKPWFYVFLKEPKVITLNKEGVVAYREGNLKDAKDKFEAGIALDPQLSYLHNNRAGVLHDPNIGWQRDYSNIVKKELNWAIELEPNNPIPYENLAYIEGGAPYDKARKYLVKANHCEKRPEWKAWLKKVLEQRY